LVDLFDALCLHWRAAVGSSRVPIESQGMSENGTKQTKLLGTNDVSF
jgi:hypothetical protein